MGKQMPTPIFPCLAEVSGKEEILKFISKSKLEIINTVCILGFIAGITSYLAYGSHESIRYVAIYIIPWAYPFIALTMMYAKMYVMSKRLVKIRTMDRNDPHYRLAMGSNAFNASVFLFADIVTLTAAMLSFYPIGFGPDTDTFHRLHVIEPAISCGILPVFALLSSCALDTSSQN